MKEKKTGIPYLQSLGWIEDEEIIPTNQEKSSPTFEKTIISRGVVKPKLGAGNIEDIREFIEHRFVILFLCYFFVSV